MQTIVTNKETPKITYLKHYEVPAFLILETELTFELDEEVTIVKSRLHIIKNLQSKDTSKKIILNGEDLKLIAIKLDGNDLTKDQYELGAGYLIVHDVPNDFVLEIIVEISPIKNTALSGLYFSSNIFSTQCEAEGFRRITFYEDHPDVLSLFKTTIIANKKNCPILLSNGNLTERGELEDGRHWATWVDPFKKPSYLFALVSGDFDVVEDHFTTVSNREVALKIYVEKGLSDQAQYAMFALKKAMGWDEEAFGREYDLDIYMIVAIGDFNMGAMENKGLNIFNTKYILAKPETATDDDYMHIASVIGHEYFHNWSGNRVTCRDWFQLSLKEGLTIFRDQSFSEDMFSKVVMRIRDVRDLREQQFTEDAGPLAHPVRPESYIEINNFYTATVYNKGAEVIRMLQTMLGKDKFRKAMDLYFEINDGKAATIEDFIQAMEDVSQLNLNQFRLWYSQAGTPIIKIQDDYDPNEKKYILTFSQHCPKTPGQSEKKPMLIPCRLGFLDETGNNLPLKLNEDEPANEIILLLKEATQTFQFNVDKKPIPSFFRNFSAPVKTQYNYTDKELVLLNQKDNDGFNRYEAGQQLALRHLFHLINAYKQNTGFKLNKEFLNNFKTLLMEDMQDKLFQAELLAIPSERYIGEQMEIIDVVGIHTARQFMLHEIAMNCKEELNQSYHLFATVSNNNDPDQVGARQLKNKCLAYLMLLPQYHELGLQQFELNLKKNMTNTQSALASIINVESSMRSKALLKFYDAYSNDALVVDKWFALQASSYLPNTLSEVKKLMHHEAFDIKNPNKVYSLIGTFGRNQIIFHAEGGEGYAFLREVIARLDKINPQVASRMVKPLTSWKRYDKERQALMREQLQLLANDKKLSKDVYELVTKSLEA